MSGRFEFREPEARAFLARAVLRYGGAQPGGEPWETLELRPGWDPHGMYGDEMLFVEDLVAGTVAARVLTGPAATEVCLICIPGSDGGRYLWRVRVPGLGCALTSGVMEETRRLADGSKGALGALAVIREAAAAGNEILGAYELASAQPATGSRLGGRAGAVAGDVPR